MIIPVKRCPFRYQRLQHEPTTKAYNDPLLNQSPDLNHGGPLSLRTPSTTQALREIVEGGPDAISTTLN